MSIETQIGCVIGIGLFVLACLFAAVALTSNAAVTECSSKGGVMTKTRQGYVCLKAEVLP